MEITEVRIKLMEDSDDRLRAFCSITLDDCFVIRDLKIIEGTNGPFVAMPSRKLTFHCTQCGYKNHLRAQHCNQCGSRLKEDRTQRDNDGRAKLYADIAHPINSECREMLQKRVISEFQAEKQQSNEPGYVSRYDDDYDDTDVSGIPDPPMAKSAPEPKVAEPEVTESEVPQPEVVEAEAVQPVVAELEVEEIEVEEIEVEEIEVEEIEVEEIEQREVSQAEVEEPVVETPVTSRHIEPAEKEPRAPHRTRAESSPSPATTTSTPTPDQGNDGDFGAGVF
jgi:stage V sporulation protein G